MKFKALSGILALAAMFGAGSVLAAGNMPGEPRCGTTDLLRALRAGDMATTAGVLLPAADLEAEELTAGGRFLLHSPAGRGGTPAQVAEVGRTLEAAWRVLVQHGGWPDPSLSRPVDVVLIPGFEQGASRTVPLETPGTLPEDGVASSLVITGTPRNWPLAALHQFLHLLQFSRSAEEGIWAYEAAALAHEDRLLGGGLLPPALLERRQASPELSLFSRREELAGGAAPFLTWLAATRGDDLFALWWQRAAAQWGDNSLAALDTALRLGDQISFTEAWRAYTVWTSYPDPAQRPRIAATGLAASLPPARAALTLSELPASGSGPDALFLEPMGFAVMRLQNLGDVGAVRVQLEAEAGSLAGADLLIRWPHVESGWLSVPLAFSEGRGELNIPMASGGEAALIIRDGRQQGGPLGISWQVDEDPAYPFELSFLAADAAPGRIDLTWGSESERGLFGWLVYRATDPRGPFRPLGQIPFPALGEIAGPLDYHYADTDVEAGALYYYLVEGLTIDGLARRSSSIARRAVDETPAAARSAPGRD